MTIVVVTNLVQQARRLADQVAFLNSSRLIEVGPTEVHLLRTPGAADDVRLCPRALRMIRGHA